MQAAPDVWVPAPGPNPDYTICFVHLNKHASANDIKSERGLAPEHDVRGRETGANGSEQPNRAKLVARVPIPGKFCNGHC